MRYQHSEIKIGTRISTILAAVLPGTFKQEYCFGTLDHSAVMPTRVVVLRKCISNKCRVTVRTNTQYNQFRCENFSVQPAGVQGSRLQSKHLIHITKQRRLRGIYINIYIYISIYRPS